MPILTSGLTDKVHPTLPGCNVSANQLRLSFTGSYDDEAGTETYRAAMPLRRTTKRTFGPCGLNLLNLQMRIRAERSAQSTGRVHGAVLRRVCLREEISPRPGRDHPWSVHAQEKMRLPNTRSGARDALGGARTAGLKPAVLLQSPPSCKRYRARPHSFMPTFR
jgi:hypothetical protein